jgi:phosphoribosylformylglycinamidine cyclo-ligase
VLHFVDDVHVIKDNMLPVPPLFKLIQENSGASYKEMYQVFNMGHRMEIYCDEAVADQIIEISESFKVEARKIGRVEASPEGAKLTISGEYGTYEYAGN